MGSNRETKTSLTPMTKSVFAIILIIIFFSIAVFIFYKKSNNVDDVSKIGPSTLVSVTPLPTPTPTPKSNNIIQMENGLKIQDLKVGTGQEAKDGFAVSVNYIGTLENGTKFDSSYDRGQPFKFVLGAGQVIKGWDIGVAGMKIGGKRKLIIPPDLAYGSRNIGNGLIPPNSTLVFEVELLAVQALQK